MDVKLDTATGDIAIENNDFVLITDPRDSIEQHWRIRLKTFLGEWFLDQRIGIPYYRDILIKSPNLSLITAIFRAATVQTPGIRTVDSFNLSFEPVNRTLTIDVEGVLEDDLGNFRFVFAEMILPQFGAAERRQG
jgi:hypothetical protein